MALESVAEQPPVLDQRLAVAITELLHEASGSLDVCEQKGDRTVWKLAGSHYQSLQCTGSDSQHAAGTRLLTGS